MALPLPSLRLIVREHHREPFGGTVLTLGRMSVLADQAQVLNVFREEQTEPVPLPSGFDAGVVNLSQTAVRGRTNNFISDRVFFAMLGVDAIEAMDVSDYEHAEHVHDMNTPVDVDLHERFDAIFDFGTLEHIFDTKQALANVAHMLKPGGRVLHLVPATNRIGHGYHMFSPGLFYDYYLANGYDQCRAYLVESSQGDPSFVRWKLYQYDYTSDRGISSAFMSKNAVGVFFVGRKTDASTAGVVPQQKQFMDRFVGPGGVKTVRPLGRLRAITPAPVKTVVKRLLSWRQPLGGLKYLGKI